MWLTIFISIIIGLLIGAMIGKARSSGGKDAVLNWSVYGVLIGAAVGFLVGGSAGVPAAYENIPVVVTAEQFEQQVLRAERPVMVDFYATQCPACKILAPTIGALASQYKGKTGK